MFCGSIAWFTCLSVAAVIAVNYSAPDTTTESSTLQSYQEVKQTAAVDLPTLLDAGKGAIVTLVAGSTCLAAHKAVLAARSPVFAAIFGQDALEASGSRVTVTDVEGPVLRHMLAYLYSLQAPQLPSMAPQLLVAADRYGVSGLKADCEQQVEAQLSVETAAAIAVLAVEHSDRLKHAAVNFIKAHIFPVLYSRGWADMMHSHPQEMWELIQLLPDSSPVTSVPSPATADCRTNPTPTHTSTPNHTSTSTPTPSPATTPTHAPTPFPNPTPTSSLTTIPTLTPTSTSTPDPTPTDNSTPSPTTVAIAAPAATPTPTTQPHSQAAASSAPPTAACHALPPDDSAVSSLRSLPAEEKASRLIHAAQKGEVQQLRALLAAGADVEAREGGTVQLSDGVYLGMDNGTALHWAAAIGQVEAVRCLLGAGAQVEARGGQWHSTPLHIAARFGHVAVVRLLLAEGSADPNARDSDGWTPLHWAAREGQVEAAAALLEAGANRGARDNDGETPLDIARERNIQDLVQMLT